MYNLHAMQPATATDAASQSGASARLRLDLHARDEDGICVLAVAGRATYREAPELRRTLLEAIGRPGLTHLVVDLAGVEKMDTAAMAVLVESLMTARGGGIELFFCTPSASVRKIFYLAGLKDALVRCYACQDDVEKKMREERAA